MNKFEMPKMNVTEFSTEDVITTSVDPTLAEAKAVAEGELMQQTEIQSTNNIFYFEYAE